MSGAFKPTVSNMLSGGWNINPQTLFSHKTPFGFQEPQALGVDLNTSNYGRPVAVVYGQNKVSGNCCWYGDFQAIAQHQGGGKGGGGGVSSYDYHSSYMLVICEGPIISFGNAWQGSSYQPLSSLSPAFTTLGSIGQASWSHFTGTQALGYSGFALIAFLNNDLGGQATTPNYQFEVNAFLQYSGTIKDSNPSDVINDICTNVYHGVNFPYLGSLTQFSNYCVANSLFLSPVYQEESTGSRVIADLLDICNTQGYFSEGLLKLVPYGDVAVTGNSVTYTPNLTPAYSFTDADYITDQGSPPITLTRKALPDCSNTVRIQYPDRAYYYYDEMVEARDQNDAIQNGVRAMSSISVSMITTGAVARFVAQNKLQRELYIRNTYEWRAPWYLGYLEPSDPVTITDTTMGFNQLLVRLTEVEEQADGTLNFTAEELPVGVGHSENYSTQANGGYSINTQVDPGAVDTPVFFRAPGFIFNQSDPNVGIAVSGNSVNWGGCQVWISLDGANYYMKGVINVPARYGLLGTNIAVEPDPDTVSTPNVTLESGQLLASTNTQADAMQTMFMVDSEIMSYGSASLVSGETYQLGYLRRGAYNTTPAAHLNGATFIRLDDNIFYWPFDPSLVGTTIYVKFLSYNIFGITPRTLASETAYSYVIGTNTNLPDVPDPPSSFAGAAAPDGVILTWSNDNPAAVRVTSIERSPDNSTWTVLKQVGNAHESYHDIWSQADLAAGVTYYYRARALGALAQAGFSAYTSSINSAAFASSLSSIIGGTKNLIPDSGFFDGQVYWNQNVLAVGPYIGGGDGNANQLLLGPGTGASITCKWGSVTLVPCLPNTTYTFSAYLQAGQYSSGGVPQLYLLGSDAVSYGTLNAVTSDGQFHRVSSTFTTGASCTTLKIRFWAVNSVFTSGHYYSMCKPQLETGSVMTGYQDSYDSSGFGIYSGSGPLTIPTAAFTYATHAPVSTANIVWSWTGMGYYNADGTSISITSGSNTSTTGLALNTTFYFYPYIDLTVSNNTIVWMAGGTGSTGYAYTARSSSATSSQSLASRIPLSSGGMAATTIASIGGSGGGGGGGSSCLHPSTRMVVGSGTKLAGDLSCGDRLLTPEGFQPIKNLSARKQDEWICITFNNGQTLDVTPSHRLVRADRTLVEARQLRLKEIVKGADELLVVTELRYLEDETVSVSLEVECGFYFTELGGALNKNGNQKP